MIDGILASGSPPFYFPPHDFEGYTWADGGCIINLDIFAAINRCLEVTPIESDIIADLIYDFPYTTLPNETTMHTLEVFGRIFNIRAYDSSIKYTYQAMNAFPNVNFRYVLKPSLPIGGGIVPLNFTPSTIEYEIQLGINDTIAFLGNLKPGRAIIQELYEENKRKITYP